MSRSNESDLEAAFARKRELYVDFTASLENLLQNLVSAASLSPFAFENRTKTAASFRGKIDREDKAGKYDNLEDVTDLSGVRVIFFLQEECDKICAIIEQEFDVDWANSSTKRDELDPDKFGYLSTHFVVSINGSRQNLVEFKRFAGLKAEIQIRTLLQHTWAAIDWKFRYKEEKEAPRLLRRRLFRISALLESADNEFSQVNSEIDQLRLSYAKSLSSGDLNIPLNTESLATYVNESELSNKIIGLANEAGIFALDPEDSSDVLHRMAETAKYLDLKTIGDLEDKLREALPSAKTFFQFLVDNVESDRKQRKLVKPAILRYLLIGLAPSGRRQLILREVSVVPEYVTVINEFGKKVASK